MGIHGEKTIVMRSFKLYLVSSLKESPTKFSKNWNGQFGFNFQQFAESNITKNTLIMKRIAGAKRGDLDSKVSDLAKKHFIGRNRPG
jgi:hypothetical protein